MKNFTPALDVQNDRKWNMDITEEVDVMRVCNVVDDERARYKLFIVGVVAWPCVVVMSGSAWDSWSCASSLWSPRGCGRIRIVMFIAVSVRIVLCMLACASCSSAWPWS